MHPLLNSPPPARSPRAILPPGPRSFVPGRLIARFGRNRLAFLEAMARDYGDVAYVRDVRARLAFVSHPELVRDILVTQARAFHKGIGLERARMLLGEGLLTSEEDHHLRQRRLMQPAFHRERVATYGRVMSEYALRHVRGWRTGDEIDITREMGALTLAVAGKSLFDADVEGDTRTIGAALDHALRSFELALLPFGEQLVRLPIPAARRFRAARSTLDAVVYRLIAERRAEVASGARDRGDLLTMLIQAQDPEARDGEARGMSDAQLRDEALTILLAGHETTANALSWTFHFIASDPGVAQRLHEEVDRVLTTDDGVPRAATVDDLARLPYARMVASESMRLRPPAYVLGRRAVIPYAVPGTPYVIPAGTTIFMSQHVLHRDPRYWREPERFDPSRWERPDPDRPKFAYFPFGAGTRICIGEQFAWMELTLVLATITRRWHLRLVPGQRVVPQPTVTLRAKGGIRMVAEERRP